MEYYLPVRDGLGHDLRNIIKRIRGSESSEKNIK